MKKLLLLLLLFPTFVLAGTQSQLSSASRTDWFPVQQTWGGGSATRGSVQIGMLFSLIEESDLAWLDTAISESPAVVANTAKISFDSTASTKLTGIENGATADQTGTEIKALYESEGDTNAFTDAFLAKLEAIEVGATADQTGSEIASLIDTYLGTTDWQSGGSGGVSQLDALTDVTGAGTAGYYLSDNGNGTYSFAAAPTALDDLNDMTDITNTGTAGQILKANGNETYTFIDPPTTGEMNVQSDWSETDSGSDAFILNKPTTITAGQSAEIAANTAKRTYPAGDEAKLATIASGAEVNIQPDWDEANSGADSFIRNKPVTITTDQANDITANSLKRSYPLSEETKLAGIDVGAEVNVNADWNATSGDAQILNKPTVATVSDEAYGVLWDAVVNDAPSKNAVYDQVTVLQSQVDANTAKTTYPGDELTTDEKAAINGAATPSSGNVFATMNDIPAAPVTSVAGKTGAVIIDPDDLDDSSSTNKFVTDADVTNLHNLGTAAYTPVGNYATAAQGAKADTATQPGDLGTAAAADLGTAIGDVVGVVDVGSCSNTAYDNQTECEANSGTWTPSAGIKLSGMDLPTGADYKVDGSPLDVGDLTDTGGLLSGGGGAWGSITGTLSNQADLQNALDAKQTADTNLSTIAGLSCTTNQIIKWNGSAWVCAADALGSSGGTDVGNVTIDGGTASASTGGDVIDGGASS